MQVILSKDVISEITEIFNYSSIFSLSYANRIVNKIYDGINSLQVFPYIGRYVPELSDKRYRELICENYRVIYFLSEKKDTIYIRFILNMKQNSKLFFENREKELLDFFET